MNDGSDDAAGPEVDERAARRSVLRAAVGIGLYAAAFGASFGAVATGSGLSAAQAMVLSLVMFSGASQFAFTGVAAAGGSVGLGASWDLGVEAYTGSVPADGAPVDVAAATIGQGEVLASPAAMAVAVSTIARGSWTAPRLVTEPVPPAATGEAPVRRTSRAAGIAAMARTRL